MTGAADSRQEDLKQDCVCSLVDLHTGETLTMKRSHTDAITGIAVTTNAARLITVAGDASMHVRDIDADAWPACRPADAPTPLAMLPLCAFGAGNSYEAADTSKPCDEEFPRRSAHALPPQRATLSVGPPACQSSVCSTSTDGSPFGQPPAFELHPAFVAQQQETAQPSTPPRVRVSVNISDSSSSPPDAVQAQTPAQRALSELCSPQLDPKAPTPCGVARPSISSIFRIKDQEVAGPGHVHPLRSSRCSQAWTQEHSSLFDELQASWKVCALHLSCVAVLRSEMMHQPLLTVVTWSEYPPVPPLATPPDLARRLSTPR